MKLHWALIFRNKWNTEIVMKLIELIKLVEITDQILECMIIYMSLTVVRIIPTDAVASETLAWCSAFWSSVSMWILSTEYNASIVPFRVYPRTTSRKKAKTKNLNLFNCQLRIESQKKSMYALVTYSYINVHRVHCGVFETRITIITISVIITTITPTRYQM